mgnify:FL=1
MSDSIDVVLALLGQVTAAENGAVSTAAVLPADEVYQQDSPQKSDNVTQQEIDYAEFVEADELAAGDSENTPLVVADDLHCYATSVGAAGLLLTAAAKPDTVADFLNRLESEYRGNLAVQQSLCRTETWNNFSSDAYRALACVAAERAGVARLVTKQMRELLNPDYFFALRA